MQNRVICWVKQVFCFCSDYYNYRVSGAYRLNKIRKSYSNLAYHTKEIYTFDQFQQFVRGLNDVFKLCLFYTMYFLGLRIGEVRGLKWSDLDGDTLHILRTATSKLGNGKTNFLDPKSLTSIRSFKLPGFIYHEYTKLRETSKSPFVFGKGEGKPPIGETTIQRYLLQQARASGLSYLHPHGFRHSCACYLANVQHESMLGVSKWLGHKSVETTAAVYVDLFPGEKDRNPSG